MSYCTTNTVADVFASIASSFKRGNFSPGESVLQVWSTYWGRHAMRRYLLASTILALLVIALGAGCDGERASIEPRNEPTVVQTQRDGENEPAGALTLDPPGEAGAMTATPTPEATDVELPAGAEIVVARCVQQGRPYHRSALLLRSTKVIRVQSSRIARRHRSAPHPPLCLSVPRRGPHPSKCRRIHHQP